MERRSQKAIEVKRVNIVKEAERAAVTTGTGGEMEYSKEEPENESEMEIEREEDEKNAAFKRRAARIREARRTAFVNEYVTALEAQVELFAPNPTIFY